MKIRWYEHGRDLGAIVGIDGNNPDRWSLADFKKHLRRKSVTCLVAEEAGEAVGFLVYELSLDHFTLLRIGVHPSRRREGIATALLADLAGKLTEKREIISTEVRERNLDIQVFLRANRYKAVGVIRDHYKNEDCFLFRFQAKEN